MKYTMFLIIFIPLSARSCLRVSHSNSNHENRKLNWEKSLADSHGLHGKSKRIGGESHSLGRLAKGIDAKGTILRRYHDRDSTKSWWKESLAVSSHRYIRENRIDRRDLLRRDMRQHNGNDIRIYRSMDDRKVKDKPQGVAAPTFEDEGDESKLERSDVRKGHANEVATVAENQEVADGDRGTHGEVNENDKRMQETGTLGSTFSDKKTSSRISEGKKARAGMDTVNQDDGESNDKKISNDPQLDDPSEFLEKLESVFSHFGDYILAIMLKNLKLRLRQGNIAETYQKRIEELTIENGGNSTEAAQTLERQITDIFGKSFQVKMDRYLKLLVDHVKLP